MLIFQEAALVLREMHGINVVDFALVYEPSNPVVADPAFSHINADNFSLHLSTVLPTVQFNRYLGSLLIFDSHGFLDSFIADNARVYHTWPPRILYAGREYLFYYCLNTLFYGFFEERGYLPALIPREVVRTWARGFIREHAGSLSAATVQLRKNSKTPERNSKYDCWLEFFRYCAEKRPIKFFVICAPSEIDPRLRQLPNVVVAKDHFTTLEQDLALIETADFHMGTASGPSTIAQFNRKPYCVFSWKINPELFRGVTRHNHRHRFYFSTEFQNWISDEETTESLISEFEYLLAGLGQGNQQNVSAVNRQISR